MAFNRISIALDKEDVHYKTIKEFYENRRPRRANIPMINHIDEGLAVLNNIGADKAAQQAFCIHPLFQGDDELVKVKSIITPFDPWVLILVMEYRKTANGYLSHHPPKSVEEIRLSPLKEVNDMLIADKIQNRKDFELYHKTTHPRGIALATYFTRWLLKLGVSEDEYQNLAVLLRVYMQQ